MQQDTTAIVWFRRDLRLADNSALAQALAHARQVVPVYIHSPEEDGDWAPGAASRWWLHHSLAALRESLTRRDSRLVIRHGPTISTLREIIRETWATQVCFNRLHEPARLASDRAIEQALRRDGINVVVTGDHLLAEPNSIKTLSDSPYRGYTPFAHRLRTQLQVPIPLPAPRAQPSTPSRLKSLALEELDLLPRIRWDRGLAKNWTPGENGARARLRALATILSGYADQRDVPASNATSHLSPHLHFGEVSPRQVWQTIQQARASRRAGILRGADALERELLWREFAHHVLHHYPHTPVTPLDARFMKFPWRRSPRLLAAWQRGETGIPIVDAGMRELWSTGFMHNRVRMIVASFLTKHLRADWRHGARWFWDTLVDADLANNTLNWQWVAGCGADAAPYFRIFNPVLQSRKFDPQGEYLRRWLPELSRLPNRFIHSPQLAPAGALAEAGVRPGHNYPEPIVDLASARREALVSFSAVRRADARNTRSTASRPVRLARG